MKKRTILLVFILFWPLQFVWAQNDVPTVIPIPQHWQWLSGQINLSGIHEIILGKNTTSEDHFTAEQIQQTYDQILHKKIPIVSGKSTSSVDNAILIGDPGSGGIISRYIQPDSFDSVMKKDGYELKADGNSIILAGMSNTGRFYAAMTLKQLIDASGTTGTIRNIFIKDYPSMKFRGVSDDMSRGQVSTEKNLKKIIRFIATYKMNVYMPYIEDIIHFKDYPSIGKNRGAFTAKELKDLVAYAKEYHVQIIPAFETLGHQENMLLQKKFVHYAEFPGSASFDTQNPASYHFVEKLLGEILPEFPSKYFCMGGDESFGVGLGASKEAVERYGLATVNARYYQRIYNYLSKHGKTVIMYGDMLLRNPLSIAQLPKNMIILDWHYGANDNYPSTEIFSNAHQPYIVSPGISDWSAVYPRQSAAWVNMHNLTLQGYRNGSIGSITSSWGDFGGPNLREFNYRGYAYGAECSWNPVMADGSTIDSRFNKIFFGSNDPRLLSIESQLNSMSEDFSFPDLWHQPFDRLRVFEKYSHQPVVTEGTDLYRDGGYTLSLIKTMQTEVPRNAWMFDYYTFAARISRWIGNSLLFTRWMKTTSSLNITPESRQPYIAKGIKWGEKLEENIDSIRQEYDHLWLRTNRKDNLDRIDTLFTYQKLYLQNIIDGLKQNEWDTSYEIPSDFIAAYGASKDNPVSPAYLRKDFTVEPHKRIKHAWLQVIGDTNVKFWVNGHEVYHNYARRQLSLLVDLHRSKFFDVSHLLRPGKKNAIAVEVHSYYPPPNSHSFMQTRPAAANVYLKIEYTDGSTQTIMSDPYWKSHTFPQKYWTLPDFNDNDWLPASVVNDFPFQVYKPMFGRGFPSFVTF